MKKGEMAKNRQRAGEFMVIVFVCLVPVCILRTSMNGFVPCAEKRPILPLDINWKNYFSCCSAVFSS